MTEETKAKVQEAVDTLFGKGISNVEYLADEFEEICRAFAYNHIWAEDDAKMGRLEACDALHNLATLVDGLRGKNISKE